MEGGAGGWCCSCLFQRAAHAEDEPCSPLSSLTLLCSRGQLQQEVDQLEELKRQNMKSVIHAIRAELADYWDKCFYSQEQRERFSPFHDGGCRLGRQMWGGIPGVPAAP